MAKQRRYEVVHEYTDIISGAKSRRPGLDQLLADARRHRFDVVLVAAFDRVARSVRHFLEVLPSLAPLRLMLADTPWPHGFGATLANVGPLSKGFERSVTSPLQPRRLCAMGRTV